MKILSAAAWRNFAIVEGGVLMDWVYCAFRAALESPIGDIISHLTASSPPGRRFDFALSPLSEVSSAGGAL
jgi:hypothetical protein